MPTKPIAGIPDLMHHKYVVRDGAAVWTGSTNWTDDSWSREENVIAVVESPELAHAFTLDFEQLWTTGLVEESGKVEPRPVKVDGIEVRPWFCPGYGDALSHRIAKAIGRAKRRVRICSPVITAAPILATLAQSLADGKIDIAGAVDLTQMQEVQSSGARPASLVEAAAAAAGDRVGPTSRASARRRGARARVHDYMHAKVTVADDVVFLGSFNLSHSGEMNAENVLEIHDPALAERLAGFVDSVRARYPVSAPESLPRRARRRACCARRGRSSRAARGCRPAAEYGPICSCANLSNCSRVSQTSTTRRPSSGRRGPVEDRAVRRGRAGVVETHQLQHLVVLLERARP